MELEQKVRALEAENTRLKSSSDPLRKEIKEFGKSDYVRLYNMGSDDIKRISVITEPHLMTLRNLLKNAIRNGEVVLMDKEEGVTFTASGVVGFDGNKLLIFNER